MIFISKEDAAFLKKLLFRVISMFGFTYFSVCLSTQNLINGFLPAFIASGLYGTTEMMKYYKVEPDKKVLNNQYHFLI
jgi:hypothetical protein